MDERIKKLADKGCDMTVTLERFLDDEEFYLECYDNMLADPGFSELGNALKAHDIKASFEQAHMLKGVIANMGLTSMYDIIVRIVEPLRAGNDDNLLSVYDELLAEREEYKKI